MHQIDARFPPSGFTLRGRVPAALTELGHDPAPAAGDELVAVSVQIQEGRILRIAPASGPPAPSDVDLRDGLILPGLVDCHTHIDKGLVADRSPNPDGSFDTALRLSALDAGRYTSPADLTLRADFQLRCAHAHGTVALRSHVDAHPDRFDRRYDTLLALRAAWQDRLTLQLCPFAGMDATPDWLSHIASRTAEGGGALSLFVQRGPELDGFLDHAIALAAQHGLDLDFHADENTDPGPDCTTRIAAAVLRTGFSGRVTIGHGVALALQPPDALARTLDALAEARITLVALPLCNMHLMNRQAGRMPRLRGIAPLHEARAAGVPVALASDNVRDPFHAYGDLDLVEVLRDSLRFAQLDHPVGNWPAAVGSVPARAMGLSDRIGRIVPGARADLILLTARNWSEFGARPARTRIVLRDGACVDTTPPDWRLLDGLEGMKP